MGIKFLSKRKSRKDHADFSVDNSTIATKQQITLDPKHPNFAVEAAPPQSLTPLGLDPNAAAAAATVTNKLVGKTNTRCHDSPIYSVSSGSRIDVLDDTTEFTEETDHSLTENDEDLVDKQLEMKVISKKQARGHQLKDAMRREISRHRSGGGGGIDAPELSVPIKPPHRDGSRQKQATPLGNLGGGLYNKNCLPPKMKLNG